MEAVQITLDKKLLKATDNAALRTRQDRSALVRQALREHLRRMELRTSEEQDRTGYIKLPQTAEELELCDAGASWPAE